MTHSTVLIIALLHSRRLANWWRLHRALALAALLVVLSSAARAQLPSPTPDGGYPNFNTAEGENALFNLTIGASNTAVGYQSLFTNTTGGTNTAVGVQALYSNTIGNDNTAIGILALFHNTSGSGNIAIGRGALLANTIGINNTATGFLSLAQNTTGNDNTAAGYFALFSNTTAIGNTATGWEALTTNTTGNGNTANGSAALQKNTTGSSNTATGGNTLESNTTGVGNTASGLNALGNNTIGNGNTAMGQACLGLSTTGSLNTAVGVNALPGNSSGSNNIALGASAGSSLTTGSNNIDIGASGKAAEGNTIRIGKSGTQTGTYIAGIYSKGVASATGVNVKIDFTGKLGTVLSSARYKEAIKPMDKASESILQLEPITFRYKKELDPDGVTQFGLVAEEVEKVCPDLVISDEEGKPLTVRYDAVNAMLLNEFLKEHKIVQAQQATIIRLEKQVEALTAGLQKVRATVEVNQRAPTRVADNH